VYNVQLTQITVSGSNSTEKRFLKVLTVQQFAHREDNEFQLTTTITKSKFRHIKSNLLNSFWSGALLPLISIKITLWLFIAVLTQ